MTDDELIRLTAKVWVDNGGDEAGIAWCWVKLQQAVAVEIKKREVTND